MQFPSFLTFIRRAAELIKYLEYRFRLWTAGVTESWIREAFSAIAQLDMLDFREVEGEHFSFQGSGDLVHVKNGAYQCVMKATRNNGVSVDEWRQETRKVRMEYGVEHETHWWEVFRTGSHIDSTKFIHYLKVLYGKPN